MRSTLWLDMQRSNFSHFDVNRTWASREAHRGSGDNAGNRVLAETMCPSHILLSAISPDE
jgi:hypothetical protein